MRKIIILISTFFYLGYSPVAPGTAGTLGGLIIFLILRNLLRIDWFFYSLCILIFFIVGVYVSSEAEKLFKKKDAQPIVFDEVIGFLITMYMVPFSWTACLIGFLLNRVLDIVKPFPAKQSQSIKGGMGIMMDDVISSLYSNIALRIIMIVI